MWHLKTLGRIAVALMTLIAPAAPVFCQQAPAPIARPADAARLPSTCRHPRQSRCWKTVFREDFEATRPPPMAWTADTSPDTVFSDNGSYFRQRGIAPPARAWRATASFGSQHWLTVESYSRSRTTPFRSLLAVTNDPSGARNRVLRVASPAHTDATIVRSTRPLPHRYRISLRVGFADFGDGRPGPNGYDGGESAGPWQVGRHADATAENGFYWLAILDALPRPHNNVWIHHHRKVAMDSDNNVPPWTEVFDSRSFIVSGERPLLMFNVDGRGAGSELDGKPLRTFANGAWQPAGRLRAVDSYRPLQWYRASIERSGDVFTLRVSGDFAHGGPGTSYTAVVDAAGTCTWHYNQAPLPGTSPCVDDGRHPSLPHEPALWPAGSAWPDYFMFGDPHNNFYEGTVHYDDVRLEVWRSGPDALDPR